MKEVLDIEQPEMLRSYLRDTDRIGAEEQPLFHTLAGGVSNRTVLVERAPGKNWVVKQSLERLRVAVEWFSDPERIHKEAVGLCWLEQFAPPGTITPLVFEDRENYLLAMEAVPKPHGNWKTMLLRGELEASHVEQFARILGTVHRRGYENQDEVASVFGDRSFFESLRGCTNREHRLYT